MDGAHDADGRFFSGRSRNLQQSRRPRSRALDVDDATSRRLYTALTSMTRPCIDVGSDRRRNRELTGGCRVEGSFAQSPTVLISARGAHRHISSRVRRPHPRTEGTSTTGLFVHFTRPLFLAQRRATCGETANHGSRGSAYRPALGRVRRCGVLTQPPRPSVCRNRGGASSSRANACPARADRGSTHAAVDPAVGVAGDAFGFGQRAFSLHRDQRRPTPGGSH